ncbi:hypothetical protein V6N11_059852 [Hibiscus sabdariffa]|uniref:Uncharacterized protein n=1 Tax=Hibiscus sabdariffa TaxID=183260 RepID=A0ABR2NYI1_9ROSI
MQPQILPEKSGKQKPKACEDEKDSEVGKRGKNMVVEEDDPDWPLDADVGALIVLVFERHKRETHSWKTSKELEKAIQVYQNAKDRLPPQAVKLDVRFGICS